MGKEIEKELLEELREIRHALNNITRAIRKEPEGIEIRETQ